MLKMSTYKSEVYLLSIEKIVIYVTLAFQKKSAAMLMFLGKSLCLSPTISCYIVVGKTFGASARGNEAICQHGFFNGHEEEELWQAYTI